MVNAQDFTPSTSSDSGLTPNINVGTPPDAHSMMLEESLKEMHVGGGVGGGDLESFESQMLALHKASAEGDVQGVRNVLSKNLNVLESINPQTGLTAMLCAVYAGQHATVRELAMAGAYSPPPTVTNDPSILAILYPPPPPPPLAQHQLQPPHHAQQQQQQQHMRGAVFSPSSGGGVGRGSFGQQQQQQHQASSPEDPAAKVNLPPAEVSRNIPCRNYPNCRYGDACAFHHPGPVPANGAVAVNTGAAATAGAFYPTPFASEFVPGGQPPFPMGPPGAGAMFYPGGPFPHNGGFGGGHHFAQQPQQYQQHHQGAAGGHRRRPSEVASNAQQQQQQQQQHEQQDAPAPIAEEGATSAVVEEGADGNGEEQPQASGSEAQAGDSQEQSGQSNVAAAVATQVPTAPRGAGPNGAFPPIRHHKKMSFSGSKTGGPWLGPLAANARAAVLGTWINGHPPPCAFFQQNKCRNGEMCKFPHILPDGSDCRHPDIISGAMQPVNQSGPAGRVPRARLSMSANGQFEGPHARLPHHAAMKGSHAQAQAQAQAAAAAAAVRVNAAVQQNDTSAQAAPKPPASENGKSEGTAPATTSSSSEPKKAAPAAVVAPAAARAQSASRSAPNTRAVSPAQHVNGFRTERVNGLQQQHAKRVPNGQHQAHQGRSSSPKQRVPSADEFPALAGSTGSLSGSTVLKPIQDGGKTAAQVLSAPAPPKPVPAKAESSSAESGELVRVRSNESNANVTTISDDDAVVVSHTPVVNEGKASSRAPISFAAAIASSKASTSATESPATVALQA